MRWFPIALMGCLLTAPALGQAAFPSDGHAQGGYGAPVVKRSSINGQAAWLVGLHGGWMIEVAPAHALTFGLGAYGVVTDVTTDAGRRLGLDYGGLEVGYRFLANRYVYLTAGTLIGAGNIAYRSPKENPDDLFVLEPEVGLHVPVARFLQLSGSTGYRYAGGVDLAGIEAAELRGFTGTLALTLGPF